MNEIYFANYTGLQTGDRLVREKGILSKHHGIYAGIHNGVPLVAENQIWRGVQYVPLSNFLLGNSANLTRVEKFRGTEYDRRNVIPRINNLIGKQYDLINFNCEHFVEEVYTGVPSSKQVANAVLGVVAVAVIGIIFGSGR